MPDPFAIDELARRANDLAVDYAKALGARADQLVVNVHEVPADVYHALPCPVRHHASPNGPMHTWRVVTEIQTGHANVRVNAWCAEGAACPERTVAEQPS